MQLQSPFYVEGCQALIPSFFRSLDMYVYCAFEFFYIGYSHILVKSFLKSLDEYVLGLWILWAGACECLAVSSTPSSGGCPSLVGKPRLAAFFLLHLRGLSTRRQNPQASGSF